MDRQTSWAIVHGVTKSRTQLSDWAHIKNPSHSATLQPILPLPSLEFFPLPLQLSIFPPSSSLRSGQESLSLESCPIPFHQAVSCNHSTSSWDPASSTKPLDKSRVSPLQLATCSEPLRLPLSSSHCLDPRAVGSTMSCLLNGCSILHVIFYARLRPGQPRPKFINVLCLDQQLGELWSDICVPRDHLAQHHQGPASLGSVR